MPRGETQETKYRKKLIYTWAEQNRPVTVRQIFYRLSTLDAVPKTEAGYKAVGRLCTKMRREGDIAFEWFADNTRWMRKPRTYNSLQDALSNTAQTYRRALWTNQLGLVEIWIEKEALAGVVYEVTTKWDVPLMVVRGYPSLSFLHNAAQELKNATSVGKHSHIFYLGDYDPSGLDIYRQIADDLRGFAPDAHFSMQHMAVTLAQISDWDLPSRPTKKTDSRAKFFTGESVELDAITPDNLRQIVEDCIKSIVDPAELERTLHIEKLERESIPDLIASLSEYPPEAPPVNTPKFSPKSQQNEIYWRVPTTPMGNKFKFTIRSNMPLTNLSLECFTLAPLNKTEGAFKLDDTSSTLLNSMKLRNGDILYSVSTNLDGTYNDRYRILFRFNDFSAESPAFVIDSRINWA